MRQESYQTSKRKPVGREHARKKQVVIHREGGYDSRYKRRRKPSKVRKNQKDPVPLSCHFNSSGNYLHQQFYLGLYHDRKQKREFGNPD